MKKILKSTLALLLVFSVLALCGCGKNNEETSATETTETTRELTPEEKFEKVGDNIKENYITPVFDFFEVLESKTSDMTAEEYDIQLQPYISETVSKYILLTKGLDLSWLNDTRFNMSSTTKDKLSSEKLGLYYKGGSLIEFESIIDQENGFSYISIPQLYEQSLKAPIDEEMIDSTMLRLDVFEDVLDMEKVETIINRYMDIVLSSVDNVEENQGTLQVGDVSENCTTLTVTLTGKDVCDIVKMILETASNDAELKNLYEKSMGLDSADGTGSDYYRYEDVIADKIADFDESLTEATEEELAATFLIVTEYIDSGCNLMGINVEVVIEDSLIEDPEEVYSTSNFFFGTVKKDDKTHATVYAETIWSDGETYKDFEINTMIEETDTAYKAFFELSEYDELVGTVEVDLVKENNTVSGSVKFAEEEGSFVLNINLTENEDVISGTFEVVVDNKSMIFINIKDLNTKKLEEGTLNGTISLAPSDGFVDMLKEAFKDSDISSDTFSEFSLSFKFENDNVTIGLLKGSDEFVSLTISVNTTEDADIQVPSNTTEDMEAWANSMNVEAFLENIENTDLPEDIKYLIFSLFYSEA